MTPMNSPPSYAAQQTLGADTSWTRTEMEIAAQVRLEYAKFLEKRDALRKTTGKLRRSMLEATSRS